MGDREGEPKYPFTFQIGANRVYGRFRSRGTIAPVRSAKRGIQSSFNGNSNHTLGSGHHEASEVGKIIPVPTSPKLKVPERKNEAPGVGGGF